MRLSTIPSTSLLAILVSTSVSSYAKAAILITSATVVHNFEGLSEFGSTTMPLTDTSPGNHFTTFDGRAGVAVDMNDTAGTVRVDTWGRSNNPVGPFYSFLKPSGTIRFTALDGDFTAIASAATGRTSVTYTITQLSSGLTRQLASNWVVPPTSTGTLAFPAPPGDYELTFTSTQGYLVGTTSPGYSVLSFAVTPEPTLAALLGVGMFGRRRHD